MSFKGFALAAFFGMAAYSSAALRINEIYINPPGGSDGDQGREFIEIYNDGTSSASLTNLKLVILENEGAAKGTVDAIIDLSTAGSSLAAGQKLVIRDTNVLGSVALFDPAYSTGANAPLEIRTTLDLENEGGNFFLTNSVSTTVGTDLDPDNDFDLDSTPFGTPLDWVTIHEGQSGDSASYAPDKSNTVYQHIETSVNFESPGNGSDPDVFARVYTLLGTVANPTGFQAVNNGIISECSRTNDQNTFNLPYIASNLNTPTLSGIARVSPGANGSGVLNSVFWFTVSGTTYYHP